MLFEHARYTIVSPWLSAPEVHNVGCVLRADRLGLGCRQSVDIHINFCRAALQDDLRGKLEAADSSQQGLLVHHNYAGGAHLRRHVQVRARDLFLLAALRLDTCCSSNPGAADACSLRAAQHKIVPEAGILAVRTWHAHVLWPCCVPFSWLVVSRLCGFQYICLNKAL